MSNQTCETDLDCLGTLVCFVNACDCSSLWGWTGENCNEYTVEAKKAIVFSVFMLCICLPFLFLIFQDVTIFWQLRYNPERLFSIKDTVVTWLFSSLGIFVVILYTLVGLIVVTSPEDMEIFEIIPGVAEKYPSKADTMVSLFLFAILCVVVTGYSVSIPWLKACISTGPKGFSDRQLRTLDMVFWFFRLNAAVYFLATSILSVNRSFKIVVVIVFVSLSLLLLMLVFGRMTVGSYVIGNQKASLTGDDFTSHEFLSTAEVIETQIVTDARFSSTIVTIVRTFRVVVFSIFLTMLSLGISIAQLKNWEEHSASGKLSQPFLWREFAVLGIILFLITTYWYAHDMIQVPVLKPLFGPPDINLSLSDFLARKTNICLKWFNNSTTSSNVEDAEKINNSSFAQIAVFRSRGKKKFPSKNGKVQSVVDSWLTMDGDEAPASPTPKSPQPDFASPNFYSPYTPYPSEALTTPHTPAPVNPYDRKVSKLEDDMI